jgi:hypothetical protein
MPRWDEAGPVLRKIIGELADEPSVYRHHSTLEAGEILDHKPSFQIMEQVTPRKYLPPAGTEIGMLSPAQLIAKSVYPDDLRTAAWQRLNLGGAGQSQQFAREALAAPLYARPTTKVTPNQIGRRIAVFRRGDYGVPEQLLDVAGASDDALRTLIHEARHATQGYDLNMAPRALSSISSYRQSGIDGRSLNAEGKRYFAQPAEVFAWMSGSGDDFVKAKGRLVETPRDANAVMEMLEAGEASPDMHPLARQLYVESYRNNKTAREHINNVLTRYFAAPGAVAAGAMDDSEQ